MQIQFDGEITDPDALITDLQAKGYQVIAIITTRWIGRDEKNIVFDRGGRFDVEVNDDHQLPKKQAILSALEEEIKTNAKVTSTSMI